MASNASFQKRQKERARVEKQRLKAEKKTLRRAQAANAPAQTETGVEADAEGASQAPASTPEVRA